MCHFAKAEESLRSALALLTPLVAGGKSSASHDAGETTETTRLQQWCLAAVLRVHVKLAGVLTDGTAEQLRAADSCFEACIALAKEHNIGVRTRFGTGAESAAASSAVIAAHLHRGQLRLMESDLEGADEDLRAAWRLSEAACAVHVPDHPSPRPGASPSMSAGGGAGGGGGGGAADDDALKESGSPALDVGGTLKRLEATSMGSLAVAVFKRELLRLTGLGGADQMGGALGMAGNEALRLLRRAEARHPEQGELFLLHGDVLAQVGDFVGALDRFRSAAAAANEGDDREGEGAGGGADQNGAARASEVSTSIVSVATALPAGCPLPYVNAGRAYLQMNEPVLAELHLNHALEVDDSCAACHLDLGQLWLQRGDMEKALGHFECALSCSRSFPELHDALACRRVALAHQAAMDAVAAGLIDVSV
mmetsp:Transcript_34362/g.90934  ORF Transcript_34362/g.90934 Transcript_34362/m.90934 type:complete len:424 (-) Transcript_34362:825-2096(-)